MATAEPAVADWPSPAFTVIVAAAAAVPVADTETAADPVGTEVTERLFAPAVVPSVHAGAVAMPLAFVVTVAGDARDPPPVATAKVTDTPAIPLPSWSSTATVGDVATAVPTVAVCPLPPSTRRVVAGPGPDGVKVADVTEVRLPLVKVNV